MFKWSGERQQCRVYQTCSWLTRGSHTSAHPGGMPWTSSHRSTRRYTQKHTGDHAMNTLFPFPCAHIRELQSLVGTEHVT